MKKNAEKNKESAALVKEFVEHIRGPLTEHIIKVTNQWRIENTCGETPPAENPKVAAIEKLLTTSGGKISGEYLSILAKLSSLIIDAKVNFQNKDANLTFARGLAIVPLGNSGDHNYGIGAVCVSTNGTAALIRGDGTEGNTMDRERKNSRAATDDEIRAYVNTLPLSGISAVCRCLEG